jgi:hypothetical protein
MGRADLQKVTDKDSRASGIPRKRWVRGSGLSSFSPFLRMCKECGVPLAISSNHSWEKNGRILNADAAQRLVIVERKIIDGILDKVIEKVGSDIEKTFIYAKARDASQYVRSMMIGWKRIATGYPLLRRPFYELLCDQARLLGMADANLLEYRRGREIRVSCSQCYNKTFFAGDILGAVYECEGREATIEMEENDGEIVYTATVLENARCEAIESYPFFLDEPVPGHLNYKRCGHCGIPFSVTFCSWDIDAGLIIDTHNGEPVTIIDVAGINAAYSQVKAVHGDWVDEFLANEVKDMVDGILPGLEWKNRRPEERVRDLFFLAYRGMGNPVFIELTGDGIKARIENPFNLPIVAGIAASFLARGKPSFFEWDMAMPGRMELRLYFD